MRNILQHREVAIAAYAELPRVRRGSATAIELAGRLYSEVKRTLPLASSDIDGMAVTVALSEAANPFWSNALADSLGLSLRWLQLTDLGGCSPLANVARAAMAILTGQCETVLCLAVDAPSMGNPSHQGGYKEEFAQPTGYAGPVSSFGLIGSAYDQLHGYPHDGLARLAVAQRQGALLNPLTPPELRTPLREADYLQSRIVAHPLRLLDCVMQCDGGSALIVTAADRARGWRVERPVFPIAYAELTNDRPAEAMPDITRTGFAVVGPEVLAKAGLDCAQIGAFHPYDDFLIAVALQLEDFGFCPRGMSGRFLQTTDIAPSGSFTINPGGGQVSGGQPGLAGGSVNLVEAIRQLRNEAGARQMPHPGPALVTGIGCIQYLRNWGTSNAMVMSQ
jgi:acetyl-CoA acetyltransferase